MLCDTPEVLEYKHHENNPVLIPDAHQILEEEKDIAYNIQRRGHKEVLFDSENPIPTTTLLFDYGRKFTRSMFGYLTPIQDNTSETGHKRKRNAQ